MSFCVTTWNKQIFQHIGQVMAAVHLLWREVTLDKEDMLCLVSLILVH